MSNDAYQVTVTNAAKKRLKRIPLDDQKRLFAFIESLGRDPRPDGARPLTNSPVYRKRIGDYRVCYTVSDESKQVQVARVGHRKDVYRHL